MVQFDLPLIINEDDTFVLELLSYSRNCLDLVKLLLLQLELLLHLVKLLEFSLSVSFNFGFFLFIHGFLSFCSSSLGPDLKHVSTASIRSTNSGRVGKGSRDGRVQLDSKLPLSDHGLMPLFNGILHHDSQVLGAKGHHHVHKPVSWELLHLFDFWEIDMELGPGSNDGIEDVYTLQVLIVRNYDALQLVVLDNYIGQEKRDK